MEKWVIGEFLLQQNKKKTKIIKYIAGIRMRKVKVIEDDGCHSEQFLKDNRSHKLMHDLHQGSKTLTMKHKIIRETKNSFYVQRNKIAQRPNSQKMIQADHRPKSNPHIDNFGGAASQPSNVGMMGPLYINIRSNPRKMYNSTSQNSHGSIKKSKKKLSVDEESNGEKHQISHGKEDLVYENIVSEMNEYFNMMRLSTFKCNGRIKKTTKKQQMEEEKSKKVARYRLEVQEHLNVVGIKPNRLKRTSKLMTEELHEPNSNSKIKYRSSVMNTTSNMQSCFEEPPKKSVTQHFSQQSRRNCRTNLVKKRSSGQTEYFGKVQDFMTIEEVQKMKIMYYKDFLWKQCYNSGWKVKNCEASVPRYFVGRGNNSKLIKAIMGKRWWWKHETKEENANFLWTQLKIYSVYHDQPEYTAIEQYEQQSEQWEIRKQKIIDANVRILSQAKYQQWKQYILKNPKKQIKATENFENRKQLEQKMVIHEKIPQKVTNHLEFSRIIGNKKALYKTMKKYQEITEKKLKYLPVTYHIISGLEDDEYLRFLNEYYRKVKQQNNSLWIVKPGEISNRGSGIKVCSDLQQIKAVIKDRRCHSNGTPLSYIIQEYLHRPLLYNGRKFDIRHYLLITSQFGRVKAYFYQDGYLRTTSAKYSIKNSNPLVHLTNDAVQKGYKDYSKFQKGNKVSYEEFQKYLANQYKGKYSFYGTMLPKIKEICRDVVNASYYFIDSNRKGHNFEIFGLDILIDQDFQPWLIEVNTNPCLEISCPIIGKIIPKMLDNAFAIAIDPLFPPPDLTASNKKTVLPENYVLENKFQIILDQKVQGKHLDSLYEKKKSEQIDNYGSDEQQYESAQQDNQIF